MDKSESVISALKDVLKEPSDTLSTYTDTPDNTDIAVPQEYTLGSAPIRPADDPNYQLWQESFEKGNQNAFVNTSITPENIDSAVSILLQAPEFKQYIGQYALSNDVDQNIKVLQNAISTQKNYTEDMAKEVDGAYLKGGESYFLQQILSGLEQTDSADNFFNQLRDKINTEVLEKINQKQEEVPSIPLAQKQDSDETDPLLKAKKIINEREGELIEDLTPNEARSEMHRLMNSPEYKQAQIENIGYDPEVGHPDLEIRAYNKAMYEWGKQLPFPETNEPIKPENYEQRSKQPKIDYDNKRKQNQNITPQESKTSFNGPEPIPESSLKSLLPEGESTSLVGKVFKSARPVFENNLSYTADSFTTQADNTDRFTYTGDKYTTQTDSTDGFTMFDRFANNSSDKLKVSSELPNDDAWSTADGSDQTTQEILANTKATNIALAALIKMFPALIASNAGGSQGSAPSMQMPSSPMSAPSVGGSSNDQGLQEGTPKIPSIRAQFLS